MAIRVASLEKQTDDSRSTSAVVGGIGRMTGKAGVAIATSGPGVSNLVTGLATANTEGDPVIALGGAVLWLTWWQRNKA